MVVNFIYIVYKYYGYMGNTEEGALAKGNAKSEKMHGHKLYQDDDMQNDSLNV